MINYDRIDEFEEIMDELVEEIPKEFFNRLNRGIIISEEVKYHPESINDELVILGLYTRDLTGNGIIIFYGSFMKIYSHLSTEDLKIEIRGVLLHEFTHHLEFLAGERHLEIEDRENLIKYKKSRGL